MKILTSTYEDILTYAQQTPDRETGAVLGGRNGIVTMFVADPGKASSAFHYVPDIERINDAITSWFDEGIEFMGLLHTHLWERSLLSEGDRKYITQIMRANEETQGLVLYFPIITLPNTTMIAYRAGNVKAGQVTIERETVEYVDSI